MKESEGDAERARLELAEQMAGAQVEDLEDKDFRELFQEDIDANDMDALFAEMESMKEDTNEVVTEEWRWQG
jgi:hypothetical protein